jgi:diguanylate cyclase (GGDEF)-like protein
VAGQPRSAWAAVTGAAANHGWERLAHAVGLAVAYAAAAALGLGLAVLPPFTASAVFPASGVALAGILFGGPRLWPGVWLGSFAVNALVLTRPDLLHLGNRPEHPLVAVGCAVVIAAGTTLQAVIAAGLFRMLAGGAVTPFQRARDAAAFVAVALLGCLVNPTVGTAGQSLAGLLDPAWRGESWLTWWLGDVSGVLVVAPMIIAWGTPTRRPRRPVARVAELAVLLVLPFAVGGAVVRTNYPLDYLYLLPLIWAAFRFGPRGSTALTALTAGVAVAVTVHGQGAFRDPGQPVNEALLLLQSFIATLATTALLLVGVIAQRDAAERDLAVAVESLEARVRLRTHELAASNVQLRRLAGHDPLTGVANRRQFDEALAAEWRRCGQTVQPLAVVLIDLDQFKQFNDTYGHQAGDDCLRQVAEALAGGVMRKGELLARYGGEEFVALFPGAAPEDAAKAAERLAERVRAAAVPYPLVSSGVVTCSVGVASTIPVGSNPGPLVAAADAAMYEAKRAGRNCVRRAR